MIAKIIRNSVLLMFLLTGAANAAPAAFQASYSVIKSGLSLGEMKASLIYSGNQYTYLKQTKANGLAALLSGDTLTERSQGEKQGHQLSSKNYLHHHKNRRKERRDQFNFSAPTQVQGNYKGTAYTLSVPNGTVDPALLELQIMDDMRASRPLNYRITEKGQLKDYRFRKMGKETLNLPAGTYDCEKIEMIRNNGTRTTTIWLAGELNYLPVQIRHNEKGDIIETQLTNYKAR